MKKNQHPFVVVSGRFDGRGRGFCVGFDSRKAADYFAIFVLFGFADVLEWWQFETRYPDYKYDEP